MPLGVNAIPLVEKLTFDVLSNSRPGIYHQVVILAPKTKKSAVGLLWLAATAMLLATVAMWDWSVPPFSAELIGCKTFYLLQN